MSYEALLDRTGILNNLYLLNEVLEYNNETLELILGGASNVILPEISSRLTGDIDTLTDISKIYEYIEIMAKLNINCDMLKIVAIPDDYESRVWLYTSYSNLDIYLLEEYDFIISKLGTNRARSHIDMEDIQLTIENFETNRGYASFDFGILKERLENVMGTHVGDTSTFITNFNYLANLAYSNERI